MRGRNWQCASGRSRMKTPPAKCQRSFISSRTTTPCRALRRWVSTPTSQGVSAPVKRLTASAASAGHRRAAVENVRFGKTTRARAFEQKFGFVQDKALNLPCFARVLPSSDERLRAYSPRLRARWFARRVSAVEDVVALGEIFHERGVAVLALGQNDQLFQLRVETPGAEDGQELCAGLALHLMTHDRRHIERGARRRRDAFLLERELDDAVEHVEDLNHLLVVVPGKEEARLQRVLDQRDAGHRVTTWTPDMAVAARRFRLLSAEQHDIERSHEVRSVRWPTACEYARS